MSNFRKVNILCVCGGKVGNFGLPIWKPNFSIKQSKWRAKVEMAGDVEMETPRERKYKRIGSDAQ
jgi:hypothetical protein